MDQRLVHWGVLGVAGINKRVFPSFARADHAHLAAIASRSAERARVAALEDNIPTYYGSYDELLDDPGIGIIYNPLPNTLHAEWTKKAADHGKHILCEKPLAPTADEAQEMVDYCAQKGVKLMDGFMWPHHPRTGTLRQIIADGTIGDVKKVTGAFTFPMRPLDSNNIRLKSELGGGSLLDVGCYPVYGIRWAFQEEPVRVYATARYEFGVDVEMHGILWFADGRMAAFDCGFTHPLRMQLEITGTEGVIYVPRMWLPDFEGEYYVQRQGQDRPQRHTIPDEDQIAEMLDNLSLYVLDNTPVQPDPQEAVKTLRVLEALAESAKTGKEVDLAAG